MSWFNVWTSIKTKTCRYLLQRYLGQFLEEQIDLEQLNVDLYSGKATVRNVTLNAAALNTILEAQGWAVEIISGHIGVLTVNVPWNALMSNSSCIDVSDVVIVIRPVQRKNNGTSMLESMWSSASNSMQLAEECMKQRDAESEENYQIDAKSIPGLEKFAETIDNILNRIKATFKNTFIRLEYYSGDSSKAISLCFNINELVYENVTGCMQEPEHENIPKFQCSNLRETDENKYFLPMFARHNISVCGLTISTEEFKSMSESSTYSNKDFTSSSAIPIMEIREAVHFRIKMKQSEGINGPKIIIESEIGSIYTLITPRQIHLILKLIEAFQNENCDNEDVEYFEEKPYDDNNLYQKGNENVGLGNWMDCEAGPSVGDPLHRINLDRLKDLSIGYSPPSSSISTSTTLTGLSKWQRKTSSLEYTGDILSFSVQISAFVSILLLEDVLVESLTNNQSPLNKTSEQNMIDFSKQFFNNVHELCEEKIDSVALTRGKNHLYFSISPLICEGNQYRIKQMILSKINFVAQKIDLYEVLNSKPSELIRFDRSENQNIADISVHVKSDVNSINVDVVLQNCRIDLDISIYDRLSAIFAPSSFSAFSSKHKHSQFLKQEAPKSKLTTKLTSTSVELIVRFPIYDARPIHDPNRVPWWQQNIRPDYMIITLDYVCMKFSGGIIELLTDELNAYYVENERNDKVWILKTNSIKTKQETTRDYVKISVTIPDEYYWRNMRNSYSDGQYFDNTRSNTDSVPFSAKRDCRESDTVHNKSENMESETLLLPGETQELAEFRKTTMRTSRIQVEVTTPNLYIVMEDKQIYEVIYNRFNTDLFMWEPSSPILNSINTACLENKQSIYNISTSEPQYSSFHEFDLSDSEEIGSQANRKINLKNIAMTESIYFSTHDSHNAEGTYREEVYTKKSQFSINLLIQNGKVELFVPVRDTENQIIPKDLGKVEISVSELNIFSVNGYNDNKNVCYLCIQIGDIKMDHCGLLQQISTKYSIETEQNMQKTFYKTPIGLLKSNEPKIKEREMLSLVIETKRMPDQRVKRIVVTAGIQQATLGYNPSMTNQFWLNQLIDFLDVVDYPIEGYEPFGIVTEMQLHLWNCAVDYRPTNFDYRAIVELGSFTISSNVISSVSGCNLRFIAEDFVLSIAPHNINKTNTKPNKKIPIDSKYLVPVLDIGLVDISVRLNENSEKHPKFDLRCSLHDAHLRTCSDSGKALAQLIEHLANDGETIETEQNTSLDISETSTLDDQKRKDSLTEWQQERINTMMAEAIKDTVTLSAVPSTSKNAKMAEYGIEPFYFPDEKQCDTTDIDDYYDCSNDLSAIINFENHVMTTSYCPREPNVDVLPQIKSDLGDINEHRYSMQRQQLRKDEYYIRHQLSEDEYCIITEDERRKVSQCGIREVKLSQDPIRIVDNHFSLPSNKIDLLKPPEDFPMPVSRYTLCEMTFTWHLYGGRDFPTTTDDICAEDDAGHFRMSDAYKHGVSYSKRSNSVCGAKKIKDLSWKNIGGVQRNHDVLVEIQLTKVRLSHEMYPTNLTQASRQVLVIHDIEIRDRLKSSEINKFLYNPNFKTTSPKSPQQMLVIKALHVRPKPMINSTQECSLRISLLPMRLNIDQDTLIFLADYFTNIGNNLQETNPSDNNQQTEPPEPIMDVELSEDDEDWQARNLIATNLELLENEVTDTSDKQTDEIEKSSPIYFREVIFGPDVSIRFDYHGRRVELSRGPIAGLLMGLGQLQCSEIKLKKIIYRRGFLGVDKLIAYLCREWLKDIKRNQLPKILKGVGPTYSFVQFIQGVIDLFRLPIEQYQRDGRLIRGLQLGAQSFTARTALAALEITSRVIQILQFTAETAFDMVSSGPSIRTVRRHRRDRKKRSNRPKDMREGVTNAYLILKDGINESANALIETAVAEHDQKGYTGAVGAVMRQLPQLVVCPAVLATQATTNILGGVKSSLVPDAKVEAREKWKTDFD